MQNPTFLEELMAAGRGVFGLLTGNRQAGKFFYPSLRGLVSSFIALLIAVAIRTYLPFITGGDHDSALVAIAQYALLFLVQLGCTVIVLRQIRRTDALVPYLVADNWVSFYITLIFGALLAAGLGADATSADAMTIVFGIIVVVLEVNVGRFVMGLKPLQIAMLIVAQLVGVLIALGLIGLIFGVSPDAGAQLNSLTTS